MPLGTIFLGTITLGTHPYPLAEAPLPLLLKLMVFMLLPISGVGRFPALEYISNGGGSGHGVSPACLASRVSTTPSFRPPLSYLLPPPPLAPTAPCC